MLDSLQFIANLRDVSGLARNAPSRNLIPRLGGRGAGPDLHRDGHLLGNVHRTVVAVRLQRVLCRLLEPLGGRGVYSRRCGKAER